MVLFMLYGIIDRALRFCGNLESWILTVEAPEAVLTHCQLGRIVGLHGWSLAKSVQIFEGDASSAGLGLYSWAGLTVLLHVSRIFAVPYFCTNSGTRSQSYQGESLLPTPIPRFSSTRQGYIPSLPSNCRVNVR